MPIWAASLGATQAERAPPAAISAFMRSTIGCRRAGGRVDAPPRIGRIAFDALLDGASACRAGSGVRVSPVVASARSLPRGACGSSAGQVVSAMSVTPARSVLHRGRAALVEDHVDVEAVLFLQVGDQQQRLAGGEHADARLARPLPCVGHRVGGSSYRAGRDGKAMASGARPTSMTFKRSGSL